MNLDNKRFGKLTVLHADKRKGYVVCKCDCGNVKSVRATSLTKTKDPTRSCGCIQREAASRIGARTMRKNSKEQLAINVAFNTNFKVIESDKPPRNNTSGCKGVCWDSSRNCWEAYLSIHRKRIHLGRFVNYEQAVMVRKAGEKKYFSPLIEAKNTMKSLKEGGLA